MLQTSTVVLLVLQSFSSDANKHITTLKINKVRLQVPTSDKPCLFNPKWNLYVVHSTSILAELRLCLPFSHQVSISKTKTYDDNKQNIAKQWRNPWAQTESFKSTVPFIAAPGFMAPTATPLNRWWKSPGARTMLGRFKDWATDQPKTWPKYQSCFRFGWYKILYLTTVHWFSAQFSNLAGHLLHLVTRNIQNKSSEFHGLPMEFPQIPHGILVERWYALRFNFCTPAAVSWMWPCWGMSWCHGQGRGGRGWWCFIGFFCLATGSTGACEFRKILATWGLCMVMTYNWKNLVVVWFYEPQLQVLPDSNWLLWYLKCPMASLSVLGSFPVCWLHLDWVIWCLHRVFHVFQQS